jgi:hypothetical protein
MLELVEREMNSTGRYDLEIGAFNASAEIKSRRSLKSRSMKGHKKDKLVKWREKLSPRDVKKFATKKTTKPKIRSQKAGRRMVKLKGQPGC